MAEPLGSLLAGARSRWMIAGEAAGHDHALVAGQSAVEADLRLLAVAGQYQRIVSPPAPPVLNARADLPDLALPHLPDALRPLARRLLQDKADRAPLLLATFATRRGHVLHPADWMPPPGADLPEAYHPLQMWQSGQSGQAPALSAETWLDLPRPERLSQFAALRKSDPAAARALLSEHLSPCPAEERLALVEALSVGLTSEDAAFLVSLVGDRSEKVRKAATHLLARLGIAESDPVAAEVAAMFEITTKGLIRRQKIVRINPKTKDGQMRTLLMNLSEVSLQGLSQALGLGGSEFVALWSPDDAPESVRHALTTMVARTGTDGDVAAFWDKLRDEPDTAAACLPTLYARLSAARQQDALLWRISRSGLAACPDILALVGPAVPAPISAALTADRKSLVDLVRLSHDAAPEKAVSARAEAQRLVSTLSVLGLLLTAADAALVLQTVTAAGIHPADPMLDRLNFNAALKGT